MSTMQKLDPLADTLERLERQLELPHISGELNSWAAESLKLLKELDRQVRWAVNSEHPRAFETIVKNQANLLQQVEKMRPEDQQLLEALEPVIRQAEQFALSMNETALAEQQFQPKRERLVNDGLSFILRMRRQQSAVDTWLRESMQRDNGVGD